MPNEFSKHSSTTPAKIKPFSLKKGLSSKSITTRKQLENGSVADLENKNLKSA